MIYTLYYVLVLVVDNLLNAYSVHVFGVFPVSFLGFLFGALAGWGYSSTLGIKKKDFLPFIKHPWLSMSYFLGGIIAVLFWQYSIFELGIGATGMIYQISILITVITGVTLFKETFSKKEFVGGVIILIGLMFFVYQKNFSISIGIIYSLIATLFYTLQDILSKGLVSKIPYHIAVSVRASVIAFAMGCICLVYQISFDAMTPIGILILITQGVCGVFLSNYYQFKALETLSLSYFTLIRNVKPVIVFMLAIVLLHEEAGVFKYIGAVLISVGAIILAFRRQRKIFSAKIQDM